MNERTYQSNLITIEALLAEAEIPTKWPIQDVYPADGETILVSGASHSGKTYILIDQGLAVATGRPWLGRYDVPQAETVIYAPSEGRKGIGRRVKAAIEYHTPGQRPPFLLYGDRLNLTSMASVRGLYTAIMEAEAKLVIVDVFRDATPGIAENSDEMGGAFGLLRDLAHETEATFVVAHHLGKDSTKGSRGHSSIKDKADQEVIVKAATPLLTGEGQILIQPVSFKNSKNRNEENYGTLKLQLRKPEGLPAPVVDGPYIGAKEDPKTLRTSDRTYLAAILRTCAEVRQVRGSSGEVRTTYSALMKETGVVKGTLHEAVKRLVSLGLVEVDKAAKPHSIALTAKGVRTSSEGSSGRISITP
jgi:hypothetical protein